MDSRPDSQAGSSGSSLSQRLTHRLGSALKLSPKSRPSFKSYVGPNDTKTHTFPSPSPHVPSPPITSDRSHPEDEDLDITCEEYDGDVDSGSLALSHRADSIEFLPDGPHNKSSNSHFFHRSGSYNLNSYINIDTPCPSDGEEVRFKLRPHEHLVIEKPVTKVIRFSLNRNTGNDAIGGSGSGSMGQLYLTNVRLKFHRWEDPDRETATPEFLPPFDIHSLTDESLHSGTEFDEDIDFMSVYKTDHNEEAGTITLKVYCYDFRVIKFVLVQNDKSKGLVDCLVKLLTPFPSSSTNYLLPSKSTTATLRNSFGQMTLGSRDKSEDMNPEFKTKTMEHPLLWYMIVSQHGLGNLNEWREREGYWLCQSDLPVRLTQSNEVLELSFLMPRIFPTFDHKEMSDHILMSKVSNELSGRRVPIITYAIRCNKKSLGSRPLAVDPKSNCKYHNLLIRTVDMTDKVTSRLRNILGSEMTIFNLGQRLPSLSTIESCHSKLIDSTIKSTIKFISQSGKWRRLSITTLKVVDEIVDVLMNQDCSVVLMEPDDNLWNPVIAALVQVAIDRYRRTVTGFERLIGKEFVHLSGLSIKYPDSFKCPNHMMFTLFLDGVYQMMHLFPNSTSFEFSSLYLIRLFDLLYLPSPLFQVVSSTLKGSSSMEDLLKGKESSSRRSSMSQHSPAPLTLPPAISSTQTYDPIDPTSGPLTLYGLTQNQLMFLLNPFFDPTCCPLIHTPGSVLQTVLFEGMYLRWHLTSQNHRTSYYVRFADHEKIIFRFLLTTQGTTSSTGSSNCNYNSKGTASGSPRGSRPVSPFRPLAITSVSLCQPPPQPQSPFKAIPYEKETSF